MRKLKNSTFYQRKTRQRPDRAIYLKRPDSHFGGKGGLLMDRKYKT